MADTPCALALHDVHRRFGATAVLSGVDLAIRPGERVALIGPNGAGKSTLFDLVSGRLRPDRGRILLHGRSIGGLPPHAVRRLGVSRSFQANQLFPGLGVREHLRCALLGPQRGRDAFAWGRGRTDELDRQADSLLERLGLQGRDGLPASALSYAEQRALELGMAVAGTASVVLLDEPTAGMSRSETARAVELVREFTAGRTLLMVEHDMGVVFELADRVAVLAHGRVIAFDTPAAVRADPLVRGAYLGELADDATPGGASC